MTNSMRFRQAHKLTKEALVENKSLNYRVQFGLNLKSLYSKKEMENKEWNKNWNMTEEFKDVDNANKAYSKFLGGPELTHEEAIKRNRKVYEEYLQRKNSQA